MKKKVDIQAAIANQRKWMMQCGGTLQGYIKNYGSKDDPHHVGDGGEAIYRADLQYLKRLEAML